MRKAEGKKSGDLILDLGGTRVVGPARRVSDARGITPRYTHQLSCIA